MWTPATHAEHSRSHLRYASDLTDAKSELLEPSFPRPAGRGRRWKWPLRELVNAILYVLRSDCPWRLLPDSLPPHGTFWH